MKKKRMRLSLEDRQNISVMKSSGVGIREIGRRIKRSASVISRELKRNAFPSYVSMKLTALERAKAAHDKAKRRQQNKRRGKRKAKPLMAVYEHIGNKLIDGWSPEKISAKIGEEFPGLSLSTSTIYRMIKRDMPEFKKHLPEKGKKRRQRVMNRRGIFGQAAAQKRHISERPAAANERAEIGHLEVDMILSKKGSKAAVLSICDRTSRDRDFILVPNLEAITVRKAFVSYLHSLPAFARRTITFDRGSEFAEWDMLEKIFPDLKVYFCTAYSPHEKGSVERSNKEFRRFFPKKTDFALVSQEQVIQARDKINNSPMKCLGWKSSAQTQAYLLKLEYQKVYQNAA